MDTTRSGPLRDWLARGETVLGVWAHPDDEAYLSAGLMLRAARAGGRVVCRHATLGELGATDAAPWPPSRLAPHRAAELAASLGVLGVTEHGLLGYPDGGCADVPASDVVPGLVDLIRDVRPDYVVTFGPDGITGHPDHIAVSEWVTAAWCAAPHGRLLYAASTRGFLRRFAALHRQIGLEPPDEGVPDEQIALSLRLVPDEVDVKRAALAAHASQTTPLAAVMGEQTYRAWYARETFREPTPAELAAADPVPAGIAAD